ncbi:MAG: fructose-1,6-bisphosphatase [Oscillospiraceae bacterium]|nr:fructose-1,6-bisphosphatase [Oscillospiraceae bacterium]
MNKNALPNEKALLKMMSKQFPTVQSVCTEIINLEAILALPKGTEHFISDLHGEYEAVTHILNNASGIIKEKIDELFSGEVTSEERAELATLIYYPVEKLDMLKKKYAANLDEWYFLTLVRMTQVCRKVASKYSRSKVRKALPEEFAYILDELLHAEPGDVNKEDYYNRIFDTIITIGRADAFIESMAKVVKTLIVDKLHVLGDIYDRGPGAQHIMYKLKQHHSVDFVWGNHDMLWIGAAAGNEACIANMLNVSLSYANVDTIENGYGISLRPLMAFAEATYGDSMVYKPKVIEEGKIGLNDVGLVAKLRKAAAILQFKLEGQTIMRHPEYGMDDRRVLECVDYENGTLTVYGNTYPLKDNDFPTIDPQNPYELTKGERDLLDALKDSFKRSERLQSDIRFLIDNGGIYRVANGNLLMHGCLPVNEDCTPMAFSFGGREYAGKELLDYCDRMVRTGYYGTPGSKEQLDGVDMMWWLWCGREAPLFGKTRMTTFERLLVADKDSHHEPKNAFYRRVNDHALVDLIVDEFDLDPNDSHIIVGHIPVKSKSGENPVRCGGRILMIDGGFCKAYQPETGIAGYTLVYNSYGMRIISHEAFSTIGEAVEKNSDIVSISNVIETMRKRRLIGDTDNGRELKEQINVLKRLLAAYRSGEIAQGKTKK